MGQIYLLDNPLLREPLRKEHVKPRLLGHWGTTPGLNFVYAHLNRVIKERDLNVLYVCGPGRGMKRLFKQFSFPGGIPSHVAPETPGSIHEGGELGYALSHASGAVFDNPDLIAACVVGDGEAETGPLATGWHGNKFLNPARDGAVLPILHLNGYKIANPCFLARIPEDELRKLLEGYGYAPHFVTGSDPLPTHKRMADALDACVTEIRRIQTDARQRLPHAPGVADDRAADAEGVDVPGDDRRQAVRGVVAQSPGADERGRHREPPARAGGLAEVVPAGGAVRRGRPVARRTREPRAEGRETHGREPARQRRIAAARPRACPTSATYAFEVPTAGVTGPRRNRRACWRKFLRGRGAAQRGGRAISGSSAPTRLASNGLQDVLVLDATPRQWNAEPARPATTISRPTGRVLDSMLSEHQCEGWLEGYLLTGRHGIFNCYEAFIHIVDSMFNQHAKWLKVCGHIPWRKPVASLNYLLSSHVWRQDHNGFSHQDPGFLDHVVNKKAEVIRVYLPPDANCLLSITDHCLRSRDYVNVVVAGKQPAPQWLTMDEAVRHCAAGAGIWEWASAGAGEPDVVLVCCGDVPTLETLAAADLLRRHLPDLKVRVVNVVDLMKLQPPKEHPHGLSDAAFDALFTTDKPVIFNFHGYPWLIHRLTYRRANTEPARPRVQGRGHDHDAVRHVRAERDRPVQARDRRDRADAGAGRARRARESRDGGEARGAPAVRDRTRRGHAGR